MVSFADIMSLLLTFFVLLVTFSTFDQYQLSQVYGALKGALGVIQPRKDMVIESKPTRFLQHSQDTEQPIPAKDTSSKYERFRESLIAASQQLKKIGAYDMVKIEFLEECISMRLLNPVLFEPGTADLKPKGTKLLAIMAEILRPVPNDVRVIGFSDFDYAKPGEEKAWQLATARAGTVAVFLADKCKVDRKRIAISGWGVGRPDQVGESRKKAAATGAEIILLARQRDQNPSPQEVVVTDDWE